MLPYRKKRINIYDLTTSEVDMLVEKSSKIAVEEDSKGITSLDRENYC